MQLKSIGGKTLLRTFTALPPTERQQDNTPPNPEPNTLHTNNHTNNKRRKCIERD